MKTHLVSVVREPSRVRDGFRDLVGELHLFSNRVHRSVDLVDVPESEVEAEESTSQLPSRVERVESEGGRAQRRTSFREYP